MQPKLKVASFMGLSALLLIAVIVKPAEAQFTITAVITGTAPSTELNNSIQTDLNALATDFVLPAGQTSFNLTADINWDDLGTGGLGDSVSGSAYFQNVNGLLVQDPLDRYLYGTNITTNNNLAGNGYADFIIDLNNNKAINWSSTLGTPADPNTFALASTIFHESLHSMGFTADNNADGSFSFGAPTLWDTHLKDLTTGLYFNDPNETNAERAAAITSGTHDPDANDNSGGNGGKLYFSGASANLANGGKMVEMYAPSNFEDGSSDGSHIAYEQPGAGLLYPGLAAGQYFAPSNLELGMMSDIGWVTHNSLGGSADGLPEPSSVAFAITGMGMIGMIARRRRSQRKV